MVVLAGGGDAPVLLQAIDSELEKKAATWLANILCKAIEEVGPEHVVQICMNNASANHSAVVQVTAKYPRVTTTNCATHCFNLHFKGLCSIPHFAEVLRMVNTIVMFLRRPTKIRRLWITKFS